MTCFIFLDIFSLFFCRKREKALQNKNLKREENVLFYKNDAALTCDTLSRDKCIWGKCSFSKKKKLLPSPYAHIYLEFFNFN